VKYTLSRLAILWKFKLAMLASDSRSSVVINLVRWLLFYAGAPGIQQCQFAEYWRYTWSRFNKTASHNNVYYFSDYSSLHE